MPVFELSLAPVRVAVGPITRSMPVLPRRIFGNVEKPTFRQDFERHPELRRFRYQQRTKRTQRALAVPLPVQGSLQEPFNPVSLRTKAQDRAGIAMQTYRRISRSAHDSPDNIAENNTNREDVIRTTTDILFERVYAGTKHLTTDAARAILTQVDDELFSSWQKIESVDELRWTPNGEMASAPYDLARAATAFKLFLARHPEHESEANDALASSFIMSPSVTALKNDFLEALYLDVLRRGLHWIDLEQVRDNSLSPSQVLQTVMLYRLATPLSVGELSTRMQQQRDIVVDEAALAFFYAGGPIHDVTDTMTITHARQMFGMAIVEEWQDAAIGQMLMPSSPITPVNTRFWFDGQIMQGTMGLSLEQIVDEICDATPYVIATGPMKSLLDSTTRARQLPGQPPQQLTVLEYRSLGKSIGASEDASYSYAYVAGSMQIGDAWVNRDQLRAIVWRTMRQLNLDSQYPGGTALNAIATIGLRLGPLHGVPFEDVSTPETLIPAYNRLLQAWHDQPHYPLSPALCTAFHLSRTSGTQLLKFDARKNSEMQIMQRVRAEVLPAIDAAGGAIAGDAQHWSNFIDSVFFPDAVHLLAQSPRKPGYDSIEVGIVALVEALRHPFETIDYVNGADLSRHLLDYLHQRLIALNPLPSINPALLRRQILRRQLNVSEADLNVPRKIYYRLPEWPHYSLIQFQTPLTELSFRETHGYSKKMEFNGKEMDVTTQIQDYEDDVTEKLSHQPVVIAKATEVARQRAQPVDQPNVAKIAANMASRIAKNQGSNALDGVMGAFDYIFGSHTITAAVEAIASGDPIRIAGLVPFVLPVWDIEEGIRLGDHPRAFQGALHLGEDVVMTIIGAGVESAMGRQMARSTILLDIDLRDLTGAGTIHAIAEAAEQPHEITPFERDPYAVHAIMETVPELPPDLPLVDQPYPSVLLENEGRRAPVRNTPTGPIEIDLHGNAIIDAPPILRKHGNTCYAMLRELGLPGGIAGIDNAELLARPSVKPILAYWNSIMQISNVRVRRADISRVLNALFKQVEHADYRLFYQFWLSTYARSETAATIVNARYEMLRYGSRRASLEFDAQRACRVGNRICFLDDDALRDIPYLSPSGPVAFQKKRMWLHESIHWLTNLEDMPEHMEHLGRGPTVYLTERVLSEIGVSPAAVPRIAYNTPNDLKMQRYDTVRPYIWGATVRQLSEWSVAENVLLDHLLDAGAGDFVAGQTVLGRAVEGRSTVQQGVALLVHLRSLGKFGDGNHLRIFHWIADAFDIPEINSTFRTLLKELTLQSETFRTLAAAWSLELHPSSISFETGNFDRNMLEGGSRSRQPHRIAAGGTNVLLNDRELYFFSEKDLVRLDYKRQYVGAIVELFLRELLPELLPKRASAAASNRGIGVLLENTIMRQIDASPVDRICEMLTTSPNAFLIDQTTITRAAKTEDAYLRHLIYENTPMDNSDASLTGAASALMPIDQLGLWPAQVQTAQ